MVEDPPFLKVRKEQAKHLKVDFMGLGLVALGVGLLEFTLDKGQEKDWFGDPMIRATAIIAVCLLIFFAVWEWNHPDPIVDLKLLKNRNFGTAVFLQLDPRHGAVRVDGADPAISAGAAGLHGGAGRDGAVAGRRL